MNALPHNKNVLNIWTIYADPKDFPHNYVARRFEVDRHGPKPTNDIVVGDLRIIREGFRYSGLTCLPRNEADEPQIVESWL